MSQMKISDLEKLLAEIRLREGDLPVCVDYTDPTDWYYQTPLRVSEVSVGGDMESETDQKVLNITMLESFEDEEE